jgi:transposase-like protein
MEITLQKRNYSNSFKFKVVLEVLKGDFTIAEIIAKHQVSKSVIHKWKKQFLDSGAKVFSDKKSDSTKETHDIEKLHATIGKLKVENDFLQNAWQKIKN